MQTFVSHSIPFKDVLRDLSQGMNTKYRRSCNEYILKIPSKIGKGSIRGINFDEGIGLMIYDCLFKEETEIQFIINEVHPLKFMFCEKGSFTHRFENSNKENKIETLDNIIVASDKNRGHILKFPKNKRIKLNNLEIDRRQFYHLKKCEVRKMKPNLRALFEDIDGLNMFHHQGSYSLKTANIFDKINSFDGPSFVRDLYIHSKTYQIFYVRILEFVDDLSPVENRSILLKREVGMIHKAVKLIESGFLNSRTIANLSLEIGLNQMKLQNGFKEAFNKTINEYLQEFRLKEAVSLIQNTDLSFSEISNRLGINSKSYFSKIVKEEYGMTPTEIRKSRTMANTIKETSV